MRLRLTLVFLAFVAMIMASATPALASATYNLGVSNSYLSNNNLLVDYNGTAVDGHSSFRTLAPNTRMYVAGATHDPYFYVASGSTVCLSRPYVAKKCYGGGYWIHDGSKWNHSDVIAVVAK
jgi:hypothetical protein